MARVAIIGANGGVGSRLVELALAAGCEVTAAVRDPAKIAIDHERLRVVCCDVLHPATVGSAVAGHDAVLSALGSRERGPTALYSTGARNIVSQMQVHRVRRLVFLSNFGVLGEIPQGFRQWLLLSLARRMIRQTLADHRRAIDTLRRSGLDWTVVRPLPMTDGVRTGLCRIALKDLPPHGLRISRDDVADFMLNESFESDYICRIPAIAY